MSLAILFWGLLALPGYVVVRRLWPGDIQSGLLGTVGLSYVAVFGVLSPISILCFVLRLPVAVMSAACVLLIIAGIVEITRRRWWREAGQLVTAALGIGLLVVVVNLVGSALVGSFIYGDARVHLARIRFLLDHGISNDNPFAGAGTFMSIYHTNLLHTVQAACTQLTCADHIQAWLPLNVWAQLMAATGAYYLAWTIFDRPWIGWVAAMFVVGSKGPVAFVCYPNQVSGYWLFPFLLAAVIQLCATAPTWRNVIKFAALALILGQVHGLYLIYAGMAAGPVLVAMLVVLLVRRKPGRFALGVATTALALAMVFPAIAKATNPAFNQPTSAQEIRSIGNPRYHQFENGWIMLKPDKAFGSAGWAMYVLIACGAVCVLLGPQRRQMTVMLIITATVLGIFVIPPICTLVWQTAREFWILGRLMFVLRFGLMMAVPCAFAFALANLVGPFIQKRVLGDCDRAFRTNWSRSTKPAALGRSILLVAALMLGTVYSSSAADGSWKAHWEKIRTGNASKLNRLERWYGMRDLLRENVPAGETILAPEQLGLLLAMLHDCYVVAPGSCGQGIPDLAERRVDLRKMLHPKGSWQHTVPLLRKHGIRYVTPTGRQFPEWLPRHIVNHWKFAHGKMRFKVFELDAE